eukprot:CAMPEP_0195305906 /NCGR_PEP_ID=MMETSP0707-20130614/36931_1 /TAXON_ID=33640 /ORGANISM="Asterionellopsis glacialis, Strain CCMP134" /LENGTH=965 /DNA_ID=CAMNT_0040370115 /DNA_START=643 /DNA_END=3543 /DNA_ORIENTATION=-
MIQRNNQHPKRISNKSLGISDLRMSSSQARLQKSDRERLSQSDHDHSKDIRASRLLAQPSDHPSSRHDQRNVPTAAGRNVDFHRSQQDFQFQPTVPAPIIQESPAITSKTEKTTPPDSPPRDVFHSPANVPGPHRNVPPQDSPPRDGLSALPPGLNNSTIHVAQDFDDDMSAITTPSIIPEFTRRKSVEFKIRQQQMQNQVGLPSSIPRGRYADEDSFRVVPRSGSNKDKQSRRMETGKAATTTKLADNEIAWRPGPPMRQEPNLAGDEDDLDNLYGKAAAANSSSNRNLNASHVHFNSNDAFNSNDELEINPYVSTSMSNDLDVENVVNGSKTGNDFDNSFHCSEVGFDDDIKDYKDQQHNSFSAVEKEGREGKKEGQQHNSFHMDDKEDKKETTVDEQILHQSTNTKPTYRKGSAESTGSTGSIRRPRQRRQGSMGMASTGSDGSGRSKNSSYYANRLEFARDMGKRASFNTDRQNNDNAGERDVSVNSYTQYRNVPDPEEPSNPEAVTHNSFHVEMSNSRKGASHTTRMLDRNMVENESVQVEAAVKPATALPDEVDLKELKSLVNDMMPSANDCVEIVLGILLESMKSHEHNEGIQEYGLQQMVLLAKASRGSDVNQRAILDLNIHKVAMEAMVNHASHPSILKESCELLWTLALADSCRGEVIQAGATASILRVVEEQPQEATVIQMAIGALRSLSADSQTKYSLKIKPVAKAMKAQKLNADIQRDGCAYLSNAAVDTENETVAIVPYEVMEVVVDALTIHWRRSNEVAESASFCLKNYTFEEANIRALALFRKLPGILEDVGVKGVGDALDVAESIRLQSQLDGSLEDIVLPSMVEAGIGHKAVDNVTDLMVEYDWSLRLTSCALECLGNLVQQSAADRYDIVSKGALKKVMEAMDRFIVDEDLQMKSFGIIQPLAQESEFSSHLRQFHIASYIERSLSVHKNNKELQQIGRETLNYIS